jgi:hypothetical protein
MDYSNAATNNTVTADSNGRYRYFHSGIAIWELVRSSATVPFAVYLDAGISAVTGTDSSTDNAVVRWDGTTGETIQNSVVTISDTGATTGISTLNASGAVTMQAAATVGTTLGVTGVSTLTGGIAGGLPRGVGTWQPVTSTPGTYKQPVTTEMYVGSLFTHANCTITGIKYLIGTATPTTQKVIVALYDSVGTRVAISVAGGTTMTGSPSVTQLIAFTGTYAAPGPASYFIGLMFDTATANLFAVVPANADAGNGVVGSAITGLTAVTPPASITVPTTFTGSIVPIGSLY